MTLNLRKTLFQLHLWMGLGVGLFLFVIAVTGAIIVYKPQLDERATRQLQHVQPGPNRLTVDQMVASARAAHPAGKPTQLDFKGSPDRTAMIGYADGDTVYVNPYTAAVLGQYNLKDTFLYRMDMLHRYMLLGKNGRTYTGIVSFFSLFIMGTGIYLWMPTTVRKLKKAFTVNGSLKTRLGMLSLHNVIGVYSSVVVLVLSFTAIPMCFTWFQDLVYYKTTGSVMEKSPPKSTMIAGAKRAPLQAAWLEAVARVPNYQTVSMRLPIKGSDPLEMRIVASDAPNYNAMSYLYLDSYSGKVLSYVPFGQSLGQRLYSWNKPIHMGLVGGPVGQLLALLGVLSLVGLIVTGVWLWVRRKFKARKAAPARHPGTAEAPTLATSSHAT